MTNKRIVGFSCAKFFKTGFFRAMIIACCFLFLPGILFAATRTSVSTGGVWNSTATWGGDPVPVAGDDVIIATTGGNVVTINVASFCNNLTVNSGAILTATTLGITVTGIWKNDGTYNSGTTSTITFSGLAGAINAGTGTANFRNISIASGAELAVNTAVTVAGTFTFATPAASVNAQVKLTGGNSLNVTGAMTIARGTTNTFSCSFVVGNGTLTVGGTFTMSGSTGTRYAILEIAGGTVNLANATASGIASQINILGSGTVNVSGNVTGIGSPSIATTTGTFNYNGAASQTIWASAYHNINVSGNNTKTLNTGTTTINNLLTIVNAGTTLNINTATLAFASPGTFLVNNGTLNTGTGTGTINYTSVSGVQDVLNIAYNNLGFSGNGTKTILDGSTLTVANNLIVSIPMSFSGATNGNVGGNISGTGNITIGTGTITVGGNWANTGTTDPGSGTVILNSASPQSARGNFYKLTLSGGGAKSLAALTIIENLLTIGSGTTLTLVTSELRFAAANAFAVGSGALDPGISTAIISFYGAGNETIPNLPYRNLTFAGAGTKTIAAGTTLNVALTWAMGVSPTVMDGDANAVVLLSTSGTGSFTMGTGMLSIGVAFVSGAFTPGGGTVHFIRDDATAQSIRNTTYYNLKVSGASVKNLLNTTTVTNKLTIDGSPYNFNTRAAVYSGPGDPIEIVNGGTFYGTTGLSTFNSALAQNIPALDFGPLTISGTGGSTIGANTAVNGTFTTGLGSTVVLGDTKLLTITGNWSNSGSFDFAGSASATLTGTISGSGTITMATGTLTIGTSWTAGTLMPGTGKVHYNGSASQTVRGLNYYDLEFSNIGTKTIASTTTATVGHNWIVNSPVTLTTSGSADVTGDISGSGPISMGTTLSIIALEGNWTNDGTFNPGTGIVLYDGATSQIVGALAYNKLQFADVGIKTLAGDASVNNVMNFNSASTFNLSSHTLTLAGSGTPIGGNGILQPATSTVVYSSAGSANIAALNYYNLDVSGGDRTFPNGEIIGIANTFIPGAGNFNITGSKVHFNGVTLQTIPEFNYNDLSTSGGNKILTSGGTIGIAGLFTPGGGTHTVTGNIVNFNGSAQTIPAFNFGKVILSGTGEKLIDSPVTMKELEIQDNTTINITAPNLLIITGL